MSSWFCLRLPTAFSSLLIGLCLRFVAHDTSYHVHVSHLLFNGDLFLLETFICSIFCSTARNRVAYLSCLSRKHRIRVLGSSQDLDYPPRSWRHSWLNDCKLDSERFPFTDQYSPSLPDALLVQHWNCFAVCLGRLHKYCWGSRSVPKRPTLFCLQQTFEQRFEHIISAGDSWGTSELPNFLSSRDLATAPIS